MAARHRLAVTAALVAVVSAVLSTRSLPWRRSLPSAGPAAASASVPIDGASGSPWGFAPVSTARVQGGPPSMLHLDPRHTNRSPFAGPVHPRLAWAFDTGGPIEAAPVVTGDGTIIVASLSGKVFGLSPDGKARFTFDGKERVYGHPLAHADRVFFGVDGGAFLGLDANGSEKLRFGTEGDDDTGAVPTPWGALVFSAGRVVYALTPDGTVVWRFKTRRKSYSSPAVGDDGTVFVGAQDGGVYAIAKDGRLEWRVSLGGDVDSSPTLGDDGTVFAGTDAGEVVALAPDDGAIRWRAHLGGFVRGALSVSRSGAVFAATYGPTPRLYALSPGRGEQLFSFSIAGTGAPEFGIHGAPVEDAEGRLYFGAQDDLAYALDAAGHLLFSWKTSGDVDAPLVLAPDGTLLVGSDDGRLYALRELSP